MADFADTLLRPGIAGVGSSIGKVTETISSTLVRVAFAGIEGVVKVPAGLTVTVNDVVMVARFGSSRWLIAVLFAGAAPPAADEPDPKIDPPPKPKPTKVTGTSTFLPVHTATFRDGKWRSDGNPTNAFDIYQGKFGGSSFGRQTGVAFYGNGPSTLAGATVTAVSLRMNRLSAGSFAKRQSTLRHVTQKTRPSGSPTLNETLTGPNLAPGEAATFTLPNAWGQRMVDGSRGGIATHINADEPYMRHAGRNSSSAAFRLRIKWERTE